MDHYPRVSKQKKVEFDRLVLSPPALPLYRGRDISPWRPLLQMDGAWTVNSLLENVIAEDWARWVCFQMLKVQYNINNIYPLCIYVCTICVYIYIVHTYIHKVYRQCNFYRNVTFLVMDKSSFFQTPKHFVLFLHVACWCPQPSYNQILWMVYKAA